MLICSQLVDEFTLSKSYLLYIILLNRHETNSLIVNHNFSGEDLNMDDLQNELKKRTVKDNISKVHPMFYV